MEILDDQIVLPDRSNEMNAPEFMSKFWIKCEDQPIPNETWVLAYCMKEKDYDDWVDGSDNMSLDFTCNLYVVMVDDYNIEVNKNTCSCCHRDLKPIAWMPLPSKPEEL